MKLFKLWIEIEEYDTQTGLYRNLTSDGTASPVPVGSFRSLEEAVLFAEQLGEDRPPQHLPLPPQELPN